MKLSVFLIVCVLGFGSVRGSASGLVVADAGDHSPLVAASIFSRNGIFLGTTTVDGHVRCADAQDYPLTVRYMGFMERTVEDSAADTVFMQPVATELPEFVFESRGHRVLHVLAYAREYSTLSTYTDTVMLFREKMVDFMLPADDKTKFKGWRHSRILNSRSYYRFTDAAGLDSVSSKCSHHFTWADWILYPRSHALPSALTAAESSTCAVAGKYGPGEIWKKAGDRISVDVNLLNSDDARRWVRNFSVFFAKEDVDFERFNIRFNYDGVASDSLQPIDLSGYSFNIDSRGRGHDMLLFNRVDEPVFVSTYGEMYVVDKEYITVREARKWERADISALNTGMMAPESAPPLQADVLRLMARVEAINHDDIRLNMVADERLAGVDLFAVHKPGREIMKRIKGLFGIDDLIGKRKQSRNWKEFRREQIENNARHHRPSASQ